MTPPGATGSSSASVLGVPQRTGGQVTGSSLRTKDSSESYPTPSPRLRLGLFPLGSLPFLMPSAQCLMPLLQLQTPQPVTQVPKIIKTA